MKNQYFGDINDYCKYGLLRALQSTSDCNFLVVWMLTPDDNSRDGGLRSHLQFPEKWEHFDRDLYAGLSALLPSGSAPRVSLLESSNLLPRTSYYAATVPDVRDQRDVWSRRMLGAASGADVVFVDPDTGIETARTCIGRKGSSKYVARKELQELWDSGCSLVIYQHFRRYMPRCAFAAQKVEELRQLIGAGFTEALSTPHALFLLAARPELEASFCKAISHLETRWEGKIKIMRAC